MRPYHYIDLSKPSLDLTFLIPVRIDTIERLQNLRAITNFLLANFDSRIIVLEAAALSDNLLSLCLSANIEILFKEDPDPIFHRTKYINILAGMVRTPYLAVWDSDVIVNPTQITESIQILRSNQFEFVFPYDGMFIDTGEEYRISFLKSGSVSSLHTSIQTMFPLYGYHSAGGGFLASTSAYIKAGMENENFYGWGPEDGDRVKRWDILELNARRVNGPMYDLSHPRGVNSGKRSDDELKAGIKEYLRICRMSKLELEMEVSSWNSST